MMFSLMTIVRNQAARWTAAPIESVKATEMVIGTIREGSDIRLLYSYGHFLAIRIRDLSLPPHEYERLSFEGKIAHDRALLPLVTAKDEVNTLFWKEMVKTFPSIMSDISSVRLCVDWQVAISAASSPVVCAGTGEKPPAITQLAVFR
jgi:hypothetical protein